MFKIQNLLGFFFPRLMISTGGGGGGGSSSGTQVQITELPEWARGYAKDTLEKAAAITEKPYQTYGGERIAGFSPMQQQAQQGAANMQTNAGTQAGMDIAGAAAMQGLNQNYQSGRFQGGQFGNRQAAQYMSPFIEQAMAPQLREAQRSSEMQGQQNAAKAVGQGAFGGSRAGLVEAERQRNLAMQQGDIRAKGLQTAYEQAQNQFNADASRNLQAQQLGEQSRQFGANLGLQGINAALQGANTIGTLGGQQFQQGMDINKLQNAYGGMQQALRQQGLDTAYQDFQNQQNYPYKQLGYMADLIRGLPLGQSSTTQMYAAPPSAAQQIGAIGAGAYGLSKFMAEGGMAYADGGSVEDSQNIQRIVSKLSDQQLQEAAKAAQARGDQDELEAIQSEMAMRASERNGLASAVTPQMAEQMAGGGIVAFSGDDDTNGPAGQLVVSPGNVGHYNTAGQMALDALEELKKRKAFQGLTREERAAAEEAAFNRLQKFGGEDPYAPMAKRLAELEAKSAKDYERGLGAAALKAIPTILKGTDAWRGIGGGFGTFGEEAEKADRARASSELALANAGFGLSDAQRKERIALGREALTSVKDTESGRLAADAAERKELTDRASGAAKVAQAFRPVGGAGGGAGGGNKEWTFAVKTYLPLVKKENPDVTDQGMLEALAYQKFQQSKSAGLPGAEEKVDASVIIAGNKEWEGKSDFGKKKWAKSNGIDTTADNWQEQAQIKFASNYKLPSKAAPKAEPKVTPVPVEDKPPQPGQPGIAAAAKTAFGSYDPDKYDYRINPESGNLQRKAK